MKRWVIPRNYNIAILCELELAEKLNLGDCDLYWTDEPIGYTFSIDETHSTLDEVLKYKNPLSTPVIHVSTLQEFRDRKIKALETLNHILFTKQYKNKIENVEWVILKKEQKMKKTVKTINWEKTVYGWKGYWYAWIFEIYIGQLYCKVGLFPPEGTSDGYGKGVFLSLTEKNEEDAKKFCEEYVNKYLLVTNSNGQNNITVK